MNKLYAIVAAALISTAAWVICNFIALGTEANYSGVVTVGAVSGLVVGFACLAFKWVNPIVMGAVVTNAVCVGVGALFIHQGVAKVPEISLELVWICAVMSAIGAASGFGYKLVARV